MARAAERLWICALFMVGGSVGCDRDVPLGRWPSFGGEPAPEVPVDPPEGGAGGGAGASPPVVPPDPPGVILWSAGHEDGTWKDWEEGSPEEGGRYAWASGVSELTDARARSGTTSVRCAIDTSASSAGDTSHGARLYRRLAAEPAYYGAWFFLESSHHPSEWWSIFLFHAQRAPGLYPAIHLWDVRLEEGEDALELYFYDHLSASSQRPAPHEVPVGRWFHLEVFLDYAPPSSTRFRLWLDGREILAVDGLGEPEEGEIYWVLGNGSSELSPSNSVLYVDDATIATYRVGP